MRTFVYDDHFRIHFNSDLSGNIELVWTSTGTVGSIAKVSLDEILKVVTDGYGRSDLQCPSFNGTLTGNNSPFCMVFPLGGLVAFIAHHFVYSVFRLPEDGVDLAKAMELLPIAKRIRLGR